MPLSSTATTVPSPFVRSQAESAEIPRPSDIRFHCWFTQFVTPVHAGALRKSGSLGVVRARATGAALSIAARSVAEHRASRTRLKEPA